MKTSAARSAEVKFRTPDKQSVQRINDLPHRVRISEPRRLQFHCPCEAQFQANRRGANAPSLYLKSGGPLQLRASAYVSDLISLQTLPQVSSQCRPGAPAKILRVPKSATRAYVPLCDRAPKGPQKTSRKFF